MAGTASSPRESLCSSSRSTCVFGIEERWDPGTESVSEEDGEAVVIGGYSLYISSRGPFASGTIKS